MSDQEPLFPSELKEKFRNDLLSFMLEKNNSKEASLILVQLMSDTTSDRKPHPDDLQFVHDTADMIFSHMSLNHVDDCLHADMVLDVMEICHRESARYLYNLFAVDKEHLDTGYVRSRSKIEQNFFKRKAKLADKLIGHGTMETLDKALELSKETAPPESNSAHDNTLRFHKKRLAHNKRLNCIIHRYDHIGTEEAHEKGRNIREYQYRYITHNMNRAHIQDLSDVVSLTGNSAIDQPGRYAEILSSFAEPATIHREKYRQRWERETAEISDLAKDSPEAAGHLFREITALPLQIVESDKDDKSIIPFAETAANDIVAFSHSIFKNLNLDNAQGALTAASVLRTVETVRSNFFVADHDNGENSYELNVDYDHKVFADRRTAVFRKLVRHGSMETLNAANAMRQTRFNDHIFHTDIDKDENFDVPPLIISDINDLIVSYDALKTQDGYIKARMARDWQCKQVINLAMLIHENDYKRSARDMVVFTKTDSPQVIGKFKENFAKWVKDEKPDPRQNPEV